MFTKQVNFSLPLFSSLPTHWTNMTISPRLLTLSDFKRADDGDGDGGKLEVNIKLKSS